MMNKPIDEFGKVSPAIPAPLARLLYAAQGVIALVDSNRLVLDADAPDIADCAAAFDELDAATVKATEWAAAQGGSHV